MRSNLRITRKDLNSTTLLLLVVSSFWIHRALAKSQSRTQEAASTFRKIRWEDLNKTPTRDLSRNVLGWGVNLTSNVKLGEASRMIRSA